MNTQAKWTFPILLIGLLNLPAWADGKFFVMVAEPIPADLPYQRALLIFDEGTETLVVQSKYDLPDTAEVDSLAWVVPVPNTPELQSLHPKTTSDLFSRLVRGTQPRIRSIYGYTFASIVALLMVAIVLSLVRFVRCCLSSGTGETAKTQRHRHLRNAVLWTLLGVIAVFVGMPTLSTQRDGVEIVKSDQVGIYDVTVIRGDSAEAIVGWLTENGFAFGEEDKAVFADYVARNWCFVTAKVRTDGAIESDQIVAEGMAAPLVLTFATDKPVYPLALTATAGPETEILLYTLSPNKLICDNRLELRHARKTDAHNVTDSLIVGDTEETAHPMQGLPDKPMILCKFKGTLTAAQMREDLVLTSAPDNTPYRESIWVW